MRRGVDSFFGHLEPILAAYSHTSFAYSALRAKDGFALLKAAIFLSAAPLANPLTHFSSKNVRAGHYLLAELGSDVRALVDQALSGTIATPEGPLLFRPRREGGYGAAHDPFHSLGLRGQQRYDSLMLKGGDRPRFRQLLIDWELKGHPEPFFDLGDLLTHYDLGLLDAEHPSQTIEVIAYGVAGIDRASRVDGEKATIGIGLADGLSTEKVLLGYRVVAPNRRVERGSVEGGTLSWEKSEIFNKAETVIDVPAVSLVDCTVSYDGCARAHWWVTDPSRAQNPRRAAYEAIDPGLKIFSDYIAKTGKTSRDQHDFESAVAWLVWMMGFSPAHLGGSKQLEAADLVVTTPGEDFAVVECTTGLLKSEHKMARLIERTEAVRRQVDATHRVLPVMVTSKTRSEVRAELTDAEKLGVLVVTREALDEAVGRTILMPNADEAYEQAVKTVADAQAKHELQQELDLNEATSAGA